MEIIINILLIVAAIGLLAIAATAVYLILQKRSVEQYAVGRADELVAESLGEPVSRETVTHLRSEESELKEAA